MKIKKYKLTPFFSIFSRHLQFLPIISNKYDHLQARFNKCQEEQNKLEREVSYVRLLMMQIKKRSLFERVLNRLPEGLKELEEGKEL